MISNRFGEKRVRRRKEGAGVKGKENEGRRRLRLENRKRMGGK